MGVASLGNKDCRGAATTASTTAQEEEGAEGGPDFEGARYFLETARQMMDTCREEASREAREAGEQDCSQVPVLLYANTTNMPQIMINRNSLTFVCFVCVYIVSVR